MRREEPDGVVAPVVRQTLLHEVRVVDELVDGHELDRGDPEGLQVVDDRGMRHAGVGAAQLLRDAGVQLGEALDVGLVDHALVVLVLRRTVVAPVEVRVDDDRRHRVGGRVLVVALVGRAELVGEQRRVAVDLPVDRLRVRVEEQLVRVAPVPVGGVVRAVHAVAVPLAGLGRGEVAVPHEGVDLGQVDAGLLAELVDQAELDAIGHLREDREVGPRSVIRRAEGVGTSRPDLHVLRVPGAIRTSRAAGHTNGTNPPGGPASCGTSRGRSAGSAGRSGRPAGPGAQRAAAGAASPRQPPPATVARLLGARRLPAAVGRRAGVEQSHAGGRHGVPRDVAVPEHQHVEPRVGGVAPRLAPASRPPSRARRRPADRRARRGRRAAAGRAAPGRRCCRSSEQPPRARLERVEQRDVDPVAGVHDDVGAVDRVPHRGGQVAGAARDVGVGEQHQAQGAGRAPVARARSSASRSTIAPNSAGARVRERHDAAAGPATSPPSPGPR